MFSPRILSFTPSQLAALLCTNNISIEPFGWMNPSGKRGAHILVDGLTLDYLPAIHASSEDAVRYAKDLIDQVKAKAATFAVDQTGPVAMHYDAALLPQLAQHATFYVAPLDDLMPSNDGETHRGLVGLILTPTNEGGSDHLLLGHTAPVRGYDNVASTLQQFVARCH